ncbi:hypothetical protein WJX72_011404 [[Myrmecia] bisecta]|uniref:Uncharacterized protein n=1 Tax=[Myrmecia] bisecta TaxID=41462 RepID=A0AAW1QSX4_9CHLO
MYLEKALASSGAAPSAAAESPASFLLRFPALIAHEGSLHMPDVVCGPTELQMRMWDPVTKQYYLAGSVELELNLQRISDFQVRVEQSGKEAVAIWVQNAAVGVFKTVWVLLTDGHSVTRITYSSKSSEGEDFYKPRMQCANVKGCLSPTRTMSLFSGDYHTTICSPDGVALLIDTLWPAPLRPKFTEAALQQLQKADLAVKSRLRLCLSVFPKTDRKRKHLPCGQMLCQALRAALFFKALKAARQAVKPHSSPTTDMVDLVIVPAVDQPRLDSASQQGPAPDKDISAILRWLEQRMQMRPGQSALQPGPARDAPGPYVGRSNLGYKALGFMAQRLDYLQVLAVSRTHLITQMYSGGSGSGRA